MNLITPPASINVPPAEIAAVDLGSNSFRLQVARVADGHLSMHDSLRDMVRLGAGLDKNNYLAADTMDRAVDCLRRFGERLRGFDPHNVRAVATNTFRVAKNAAELLDRAQEALGFPIEIIAGREEARMIFIGVSHDLPPYAGRRLVIDIGGGSTEFVIGQGFEPDTMESLYMGCVSYTLKFFEDGKLSEGNLKRAEIAARSEIQIIRRNFSAERWDEAIGSSGTARTLSQVLLGNGLSSDGSITRAALFELKNLLMQAKDIKNLKLTGLSEERAQVIAGGFCILLAAFAELGIERMNVSNTALRAGVLYELLGRIQHHDTRETTVRLFMRRYHVDAPQAKRVQALSLTLLKHLIPQLQMEKAVAKQYLSWAARLHEIGISIAHASYHKHSAYIVENADMPGFSKMEQQMLGLLLRAQRRSLTKLPLPPANDDRIALIIALRLAVLFHRNRMELELPKLKLSIKEGQFELKLPAEWLTQNPLTETELDAEVSFCKGVGVELMIQHETRVGVLT
jgi:exopolyphosphatase/guanosine-5'-triphosphate,3'-diphosphate pyrophosphatase